jgi:hypothetical protein
LKMPLTLSSSSESDEQADDRSRKSYFSRLRTRVIEFGSYLDIVISLAWFFEKKER